MRVEAEPISNSGGHVRNKLIIIKIEKSNGPEEILPIMLQRYADQMAHPP